MNNFELNSDIEILKTAGFTDIKTLNYNTNNNLILSLQKKGFHVDNIYINGGGDILLIGNGGIPYGILLSDKQIDEFDVYEYENIILISNIGYGTGMHKEKFQYQVSDKEKESIISHELIELKYWSKMKDKLSFIPRPESVGYYLKQGVNIDDILSQDQNTLTREFLRGELIHLRANKQGYKKINYNKALIIQTFDRLDLQENIKNKLKNAYIDAIKLLKLISLLEKKGNIKEVYSQDNNKNGLLAKIPFVEKIIQSEINEEEFLNILENPYFEIEKILQTRKISHNIENVLNSLKIDQTGFENWTYYKLNMDGYYSHPISVRTSVNVTKEISELNSTIQSYVNKIIKEYEGVLTEEIINLCISYAVDNNKEYLNLAINDFNVKSKNIDLDIKEVYKKTVDSDSGFIISGNRIAKQELNGISKVEKQLKNISQNSYNLVLAELGKKDNKSQDLLNNHKNIEASIFEESNFGSFFEEEMLEIDFDSIKIENFELFAIGEEIIKGFEEEYSYKGGNKENLSYDEEIIDSHNKRIIVKENGNIIFDLTVGNRNEENDFIFHYHDFCSGSEEYTTKMIIDRVNSKGVININLSDVENKENIKEEIKITY